ncbi:hypothetical protein PMAYCL1PPCAC_04415, partial [Pristionchus mayeri]
ANRMQESTVNQRYCGLGGYLDSPARPLLALIVHVLSELPEGRRSSRRPGCQHAADDHQKHAVGDARHLNPSMLYEKLEDDVVSEEEEAVEEEEVEQGRVHENRDDQQVLLLYDRQHAQECAHQLRNRDPQAADLITDGQIDRVGLNDVENEQHEGEDTGQPEHREANEGHLPVPVPLRCYCSLETRVVVAGEARVHR